MARKSGTTTSYLPPTDCVSGVVEKILGNDDDSLCVVEPPGDGHGGRRRRRFGIGFGIASKSNDKAVRTEVCEHYEDRSLGIQSLFMWKHEI